jgi:hypothetical protein
MQRLKENFGAWIATVIVWSAGLALGLAIVAVLLGDTE